MIYPVPKPKSRVRVSRKTLKRRTRMKPRNAKRKGHAFPKNVDLAYRAFIRGEPCILAGRMGKIFGPASWWFTPLHVCTSRTRGCHVIPRGRGGKDIGNMYPGCDSAHDEQGVRGIPAFEKRWDVNLENIAAGLGLRYQETGGM